MNLQQDLINEIINRILAVTPADRIIIFGSAAAGEMTRDSDIDLLVLNRPPATPARKASISAALSVALAIPLTSSSWPRSASKKARGLLEASPFRPQIWESDL
jgi:predicted nucleotidyltransferase